MVTNVRFFSINRVCIGVLFFWLILIFIIRTYLFKRIENDSSTDNTDLILARINRANLELDSLRAQNKELRLILDNLKQNSKLSGEDNVNEQISNNSFLGNDPKLYYYNHILSNIGTNFNDLWFYLDKHLKLNNTIKSFLDEQHLNINYQLELLKQRDFEWKKNEINNLAKQIQKTIFELQNPENCDTAKKLICNLNKGCGFGCQIHHVIYCLVVALANKRTLILNSKNWHYVPKNQLMRINQATDGWSLVFENLSETCLSPDGKSKGSFKKMNDDFQVLDLPIIDVINKKPEYLPLAIPSQLADKLTKLHKQPSAWFLGQLASFIMRPSTYMMMYMDKFKSKFDLEGPIVGIQVRRTDKIGTEASFHFFNEYMEKVEEYFSKLDYINARKGIDKKLTRKIYLATDDPNIWKESVEKFRQKDYIFIGDPKVSKTADLSKRYSVESLKNIILDIFLLSKCDYLVCTFSSQVCRLAYELMQTNSQDQNIYENKADYAEQFYSLDDVYYFGGQRPHNQIAILNHKPQNDNQIEIKVGDKIGIAGNHWDGFSKGLNRRTQKQGLYPSFKVKDLIESYPFKAFN